MEDTLATNADDAAGKAEPVNEAETPATAAPEPLTDADSPTAPDPTPPASESTSPVETTLPSVPETVPPAHSPVRLTETWGDNPRMRHIPSLEWLIDKLDRDLRERIEIVLAPITDFTPQQRATLDDPLKALCISLERLADVARHSRGSHPPNDLLTHVTWSLNNAVSSVRTIDADLFGRRYPVQTHERSKSEPVYAAVLSVIAHLQALTERVREIDPQVDEKLYATLAKLEEPMRSEPMA